MAEHDSVEYNPKEIEAKWQKKWLEEKVFAARDESPKQKYYQLETFPYPSAAGLHVGHPKGYIAEDIHARYMRMGGDAKKPGGVGAPREVLYTMGWDAFGLPTENYAIKVGRSPKEVARENTDNFRRQVRMFGFSYDWDREIDTSSPEYYKWTQWLFLQLFKKGLAYRAKARVNWCPNDQTVLANEQVVDGCCERCGAAIEERDMEQWFFKITDYAERLLDDLKGLDWPAATIKRQEDWIGKSEGAEIDFPLTLAPPSMDLVFATNNQGKLKRMQKLFAAAGLHITLKMPEEVGIAGFDITENGKTLAENAEKKARAIAALTDLPVFADDTGFFIDGATLDPITVKRNALAGIDEKSLTVDEISEYMRNYYKSIARARGGRVDAEWRHALCFVTPEKIAIYQEAVRPVILTDEFHGTNDPHLPLRGLYISKVTGKYPLEQTEEEEMRELQPITDGIKKLFTPALKIFTTRPDTLFGATYLVLAPEHPFVSASLERKILENDDEVKKYVEAASHKTERMRLEAAREKTGVELRGVTAINPATKEEIPIWVADYVLGSYGTGAIMAVPAHDERDFEFAKKFGLPARQVVAPFFEDEGSKRKSGAKIVTRKTVYAVLTNPRKKEYLVLDWKEFGWRTFIMGGVKEGEDAVAAAEREIREETGYANVRFVKKLGRQYGAYFAAHKNENRIADAEGLLFELIDEKREAVSAEEEKKHEASWIGEENVGKVITISSQRYAWEQFQRERAYVGEGVLIDSGQFDGMDSETAKWKIAESVGGARKTQFKLRDWSVSRQRYWGVPIPVTHCSKCGIVPVPESDLPVLLPDLENYRPQGMPPLAGSPEFMNVKCPRCGGDAKRDPETLDTFVDSSWYYLRYTDPHNGAAIFDKAKAMHWLPVDLYVIGAEHTVLHLLYSRFITKFLQDEGWLNFSEPFLKLRHQGLVLAADGQKMSKSKGNVVNPDEVVDEFGADAARLFWMFIGPFEDANLWNSKGILGLERFLKRFWKYIKSLLTVNRDLMNARAVLSHKSLLHKTIKKVGEDIEHFKFNTAISALMILLNELEKAPPLPPEDITFGSEEKTNTGSFSPSEPKEQTRFAFVKSLLKILHPFAPHMAQELWSLAGNRSYLDFEPWPAYDPALIKEEKIKLGIQVNGKTRVVVEVDATITEAEAKKLALENDKIKKITGGAEPKKIIYVEKKLVNVVA